MKYAVNAITGYLIFASFSFAHATTDAERYDVWLGEIFTVSDLIGGGFRKEICRADDASYLICFSIDDPRFDTDKRFSISISISPPSHQPDIKLSGNQWPEISIDGRMLFNMNKSENPEEDFVAFKNDEYAFWRVVNYSNPGGFGSDRSMPNTALNYDFIINGETLNARIPLSDGTEHTMELPLEGLNPVLKYLIPECCRNIE